MGCPSRRGVKLVMGKSLWVALVYHELPILLELGSTMTHWTNLALPVARMIPHESARGFRTSTSLQRSKSLDGRPLSRTLSSLTNDLLKIGIFSTAVASTVANHSLGKNFDSCPRADSSAVTNNFTIYKRTKDKVSTRLSPELKLSAISLVSCQACGGCPRCTKRNVNLLSDCDVE